MFLNDTGKQATSNAFISKYDEECERAIVIEHASGKVKRKLLFKRNHYYNFVTWLFVPAILAPYINPSR